MQRSLGCATSISNLEAQADEFGYFSLDPRVFGNQETADTLPIIQWMSPAFSNSGAGGAPDSRQTSGRAATRS